MLTRLISWSTATLLALAAFLATTDPAIAKGSKERRVEALIKNPPDYAVFEARRKESVERQLRGERGFMAIAGGLTDTKETAVNPRDFISDPELEAKIKGIISDLVPEKLTSVPDVRILFLGDQSFSPFATRGGAIVIPLGFLEASKTVDQFQFSLSHELSHILNDDFRSTERRDALIQTASVAIYAANIAAGYGAGGSALRNTVRGSEALILTSTYVLGPGWQRKEEMGADLLGFDLSMDEGKSPEGAIEVLETAVRSHEAVEAALDKLCGKKTSVPGLFAKGLAERALGVPGAFRGEGENPNHPLCRQRDNIAQRMLSKYPDPKKRLANLTDYQAEFFADLKRASTPFEEGSALASLGKGGQMERISFAHLAEVALDMGDMPGARQYARKSLKDSSDASPKPRFANYLVAKADGKRAEAIRHLEIVFSSEETGEFRLYNALGQEYYQDGRYERALAAVNQGQKFYGEALFFPLRVKILKALGRYDEASSTLASCTASGDDGLADMCRTAMEPAYQPSEGGASSTATFASLLALPAAAGVARRLELEDVTVFAPSDAAFAKFDPSVLAALKLPENSWRLNAFLAAHIVGGKASLGGSVVGKHSVMNGAGGSLLLDSTPPRPTVNGVAVVGYTLSATNGAVQVVSDVLASPSTGEMLGMHVAAPAAGSDRVLKLRWRR